MTLDLLNQVEAIKSKGEKIEEKLTPVLEKAKNNTQRVSSEFERLSRISLESSHRAAYLEKEMGLLKKKHAQERV